MKEYIERESLMGIINDIRAKRGLAEDEEMEFTESDIAGLLLCIPAADVAPVRRGKWEGTADGYADGELVYDMWNCSECGFDADGAEEEPQWEFCPCCGARMDEGADNGE